MKALLEKIAILSLSLILVSAFAISSAMPDMIDHFAGQGISASQVELLATLPSFTIMASLLLNAWYSRFLSERQIIVLGLILISLCGAGPAFLHAYPIIFLLRLGLGFGLGMINARAINIISAHYQGKERIQTLGLRGSAEVLGSAIMTAIVGLLLPLGWQAAFLVYLCGLVILLVFLLFVPDTPEAVSATADSKETKPSLTRTQVYYSLGLALVAFFVINVNSAITLRIPQIVVNHSLGSASQASYVLSAMQLMGIVSGVFFGPLLAKLKGKLLPASLLIFALAIFLVHIATSIWTLALGGLLSGFFYSLMLNLVFSTASERTPAALLNTVTTIVLIGCNLGGGTSSLLPNWLDQLLPTTLGALGFYATLSLILALILFWKDSRAK
ncbi:MFS transporter [Streptococcus caprae]|uniref:MFS transporter n=1 Tax=Streptococcus caprae TaxID=1640501 RepID=A0ABV8CSY3_9STRE